jgi:hypothetical protein
VQPARVVKWNKDGKNRLERVRGHERGGVINARIQHHGNVEGARRLVTNLEVGVEERYMAEPLTERDALVNDAEHGSRSSSGCAMRSDALL